MEGVFYTLAAIAAAFLGGFFFKDKFQKRRDVDSRVDAADNEQREGARRARERYEARVKEAERQAAEDIASRPVTDDPVHDLADRIRRRRERIRRQRNGQ